MKMGTYRSKDGSYIHKVIMGDDRGVVLEDKLGNRNWWTNDELLRSFVEHKEPRTLTFFVNIYENPNGTLRAGTVWGTREKALASRPRNANYIDTMEVTWTEKTDG